MVLMKIAQPKTNIRRTLLAKMCFDFMVGSLTIELGFSQQVAPDRLKTLRNSHFAAKVATCSICGAGLFCCDGIQILAGREGRKNRYVKGEAIDARTLVRAQTTHLCLDSQFNLPGLIIPIGINIDNVPGRKSSRRDVGGLGFHD
jgi:hypothetical protein